jgi:hypothetical protein
MQLLCDEADINKNFGLVELMLKGLKVLMEQVIS